VLESKPFALFNAAFAVGLCTLTPPDPQLKGAWFQTHDLSPIKRKNRFQNLPFKCNVHRYDVGRVVKAALVAGFYPQVGLRTVN
jgi:hypothetical protein